MILLNEAKILENLPLPVNLHLAQTIDSTNRYLKALPASSSIEICCAEEQTQGRGRFGREWHSPFGENIYFSGRWHLNTDLSRLSSLSLLIGLAVLATLYKFKITQTILLKWPNDLIWEEKKLGGILVELIDQTSVVIGIGLNINSITQDKPWCSLYEITSKLFDRNLLITELIIQLDQHIQQFLQVGFEPFIATWQQFDSLYQKQITVSQPLQTISGVAQGINQMGQLILIDKQGVTHYLSSGETSLKELGFKKI